MYTQNLCRFFSVVRWRLTEYICLSSRLLSCTTCFISYNYRFLLITLPADCSGYCQTISSAIFWLKKCEFSISSREYFYKIIIDAIAMTTATTTLPFMNVMVFFGFSVNQKIQMPMTLWNICFFCLHDMSLFCYINCLTYLYQFCWIFG